MMMAYMCVTLLIRGTVSQWYPLANLRNSMIMAYIANLRSSMIMAYMCVTLLIQGTVSQWCPLAEEQYDHGIHVHHVANPRNCITVVPSC